MIFIPYGYLLLLPGDTIHAGGFQQCFQSEDLRLHLYVYVDIPYFRNTNVYLSPEEYPANRQLSEEGGLLHTLFNADSLPQPRQKRKALCETDL